MDGTFKKLGAKTSYFGVTIRNSIKYEKTRMGIISKNTT
jgi:hypothetical protein